MNDVSSLRFFSSTILCERFVAAPAEDIGSRITLNFEVVNPATYMFRIGVDWFVLCDVIFSGPILFIHSLTHACNNVDDDDDDN